ncbi:MAG: acyl-CoA dehydrogenase family protein [Deltaproteobacteria bacterium]|nr:acyl-CoA dehydrogenase family protein [Deltaproteobacteria bacterium]
MHLELDDTQRMVQETARAFAEKTLRPNAAQYERDEKIPASVLRSLADLGLLSVNIPARFEGAEAGAVAYALAMQEIARGCASTAVTMAVTNMVGEVINQFGTEAQRERYVRGLATGELVAGSFALSETEAGSDPGAMRTTATLENDRWILRGNKQWITSADFAGVFVVWARTGGPGTAGISTFLMPANTPGLRISKHEDKMGLRASSTCALVFDDCELPQDALLGELGHGFRIAMMALDGGRIGIGAQACGIASAALEEAISYAKDRTQFGKPIADFQAIQWMIADSQTELDAAKLLVMRAASLKQAGVAFSREAAMAKLFASEKAGQICDRVLQIHGGYGYTRDFAIERHVRDVRVSRIYEGTSEIQRTVIGRMILR